MRQKYRGELVKIMMFIKGICDFHHITRIDIPRISQ